MATNKKELDIRYLAGFVDGEGCIDITRTKNGLAGNNYRYLPYLAINNTNYEILQRIKMMYPIGRKIARLKNQTGKPEENELRYKYYISVKMLKKNPTEVNLPILEATRNLNK